MKACHACSATIEQKFIGRADECPKCGADLHVCRNCRFYDEHMSRSCREPQAEPPREKDRSNFCDYFDFDEGGPRAKDDAAEAAKAAFDALFGAKKK
jgi:hypothetical protein